MSQATELRYAAVEIRDYHGIRLDPSIGPRDNSIRGIQTVDLGSYTLKVSGLTDIAQVYTYDEVLQMEHHQRLITLHCVEGWEATILWKGVRLMDLLDDAGLKDDAQIVIFHCATIILIEDSSKGTYKLVLPVTRQLAGLAVNINDKHCFHNEDGVAGTLKQRPETLFVRFKLRLPVRPACPSRGSSYGLVCLHAPGAHVTLVPRKRPA